MQFDKLHLPIITSPAASRRLMTWLNRLGFITLFVLTIAIYFHNHAHQPWRPVSAQDMGWFDQGADQTQYYKAAVAWAHGNLDEAQHNYLPGYPLMAAPFARIMLQPFLIPDLICLVLSLFLFSRLTACLYPDWAGANLIGAAVFVGCTVMSPAALYPWVVPISSTGSTPVIYGCLLAALLFIDAPRRARYAFLAATAAIAIIAFRPSDAIPIISSAAVGMCFAIWRARLGWHDTARVIGAAIAGGLVSLLPLLLIYYFIYGLKESAYIEFASALGFEWRLIPMHWITLFLDPRPLMADGEGLGAVFPWIIPGLAGCIALMALPTRAHRRLIDGTMFGAVLLNILLYCAFRDLHPMNLMRFMQYHYFKWIIPVCGLYAVRFAWVLLAEPRRPDRAAIAAAVILLITPWRVELAASPQAAAPSDISVVGAKANFIEDLSHIQNTFLVAATDVWSDAESSDVMRIGDKSWGYYDFRLYPEPSGFMVAPLRPLNPGDGTLTVAPPVVLRSGSQTIGARQKIVWGLPCMVFAERRVCQPTELIPPADFALGSVLAFNGPDLPYLANGWSFVQTDGRWTDGSLIGLRFHLVDMPILAPLILQINLRALYFPPGVPPLRVRLQVNGQELSDLVFNDSNERMISAVLPLDLVGAAKNLSVALRIDNPRDPRRLQDWKDTRLLGLWVHTLQIRYEQEPSSAAK